HFVRTVCKSVRLFAEARQFFTQVIGVLPESLHAGLRHLRELPCATAFRLRIDFAVAYANAAALSELVPFLPERLDCKLYLICECRLAGGGINRRPSQRTDTGHGFVSTMRSLSPSASRSDRLYRSSQAINSG